MNDEIKFNPGDKVRVVSRKLPKVIGLLIPESFNKKPISVGDILVVNRVYEELNVFTINGYPHIFLLPQWVRKISLSESDITKFVKSLKEEI